MKTTLLLIAVVGLSTAVPNGYYHQEYNYKTSSSSYKNNELQHKNDDEGYYSKAGDLEGRSKPKVNAHSQHSEYINPRLRDEYNTGYYNGLDGQSSSYGHMRAENDLSLGHHGSGYGIDENSMTEGVARTNSMQQNSGYSYSGSYGVGSLGSSQTYDINSNLRQIAQRLQEDIARQLQHEIHSQQQQFSQMSLSNTQKQSEIHELEEQLKRNLTERFQEALRSQYGSQGIRGGYSYTITGGRLQPTANYNNQELTDLTKQIENNLTKQLHEAFRTTSSSSSSSSSNSYYEQSNANNYRTTVRPVFRPTDRPTYPIDRPSYPSDRTSYPAYRPTPDDYVAPTVRYTPVPNPESITVIATRVQNEMDARLNHILEETQRRYFSEHAYYDAATIDNVLQRLQQEVRANITQQLNDEIRRNYGNQIQQDNYMYTLGANGQHSTVSNYNLRDFENLQRQIEVNLLEKLKRDFQSYKTRYNQVQVNQVNRYDLTTVRTVSTGQVKGHMQQGNYDNRYTSRPSAPYIFPLIPTGSQNTQQGYQIPTGSQNTQQGYQNSYSYGMTGSNQYESSGGSIAQLQSRLQQDLSRQLQAAINSNRYGQTYSGSSSYNPQSYQTSFQRLSDELSRNLTRQMQLAQAQYGSQSMYEGQLANLRSQLHNDLLQQLQQGLQQTYSHSSSYSASSSSSSSNYRPVRGFDNYNSYNNFGQYKSGGSVSVLGEDCVQGDDPTPHLHSRQRRSYFSHPRNYSPNYGPHSQARQFSDSPGAGNYRRNNAELGQQEIDDDEANLTQQVEDAGFGQAQVDDDEQVEEVPFAQIQAGHLGGQRQVSADSLEVGQQVDDTDTTQQVVQEPFGKLQIAQTLDDTDTTQQVEQEPFGQLQSKPSSPYGHQNVGQQIDDADSTQQVEEEPFGKLQIGNQQVGQRPSSPHSQQTVGMGQQIDDTDTTQQVEEEPFAKLQIGNQRVAHKPSGPLGQQTIGIGQQIDDTDTTQQEEEAPFGKLQIGSQQIGQELDDTDTTQQVEQEPFGQLQIGNQKFGRKPPSSYNQQNVGIGQQTDDSGITQQVEEVPFGKLQIGNQQTIGQELDGTDTTQQVEEEPYEQLQIGSGQRVYRPQHPTSIRQIEVGQQIDAQQVELGQEVDDTDTTQQVVSANYIQPNVIYKPQRGPDEQDESHDLTQQVEESNFGKLEIGNQRATTRKPLVIGQQIQQTNDAYRGSGQLQVGNQPNSFRPSGQHSVDLSNQRPIDNSRTPESGRIISNGYIVPSQRPAQPGQHQTDYSDLTQQVEDTYLTQQIEVANQPGTYSSTGRKPVQTHGDLTQQTEDTGFGKLQIGNQQGIELGQQVDDTDTQQIEQVDFGNSGQSEINDLNNNGKLQQMPSQFVVQQPQLGQQQIELGQQEDSSDLTQQTIDDEYGQIQVGNQRIPPNHQSSLNNQQTSQMQQQKVTDFLQNERTNTERFTASNQVNQSPSSGTQNTGLVRPFYPTQSVANPTNIPQNNDDLSQRPEPLIPGSKQQTSGQQTPILSNQPGQGNLVVQTQPSTNLQQPGSNTPSLSSAEQEADMLLAVLRQQRERNRQEFLFGRGIQQTQTGYRGNGYGRHTSNLQNSYGNKIDESNNNQYFGTDFQKPINPYDPHPWHRHGPHGPRHELHGHQYHRNYGYRHHLEAQRSLDQPSTSLQVPEPSYGLNTIPSSSSNQQVSKPFSASKPQGPYVDTSNYNQSPVNVYNKPLYGSNTLSISSSTPRQVLFAEQKQTEDFETVSPIKPLVPQQASVIEPVQSISSGHSSPMFVKGKPLKQLDAEAEVATEVVAPEEVEAIIPPTSTEAAGFWKRQYNKVKDGAKSLKEKIIG